MKDEKELKPVSMRVRDAAEALLTTILEQIVSKLWGNSVVKLKEISISDKGRVQLHKVLYEWNRQI